MKKNKFTNLSLIIVLASKNTNLDISNQKGETSLHLAVQVGSLTSVQILVQLGCDIDLNDNNGRNALFYCIPEGNNLFIF